MGLLSWVTDDVLGLDPSGGGIYSAARDVLGNTIADDILGMDPTGKGFVGAYNTILPAVGAYYGIDALGGWDALKNMNVPGMNSTLGEMASKAGTSIESFLGSTAGKTALSAIAPSVIGGMMTNSAINKASQSQAAAEAARLAEEVRVREQLRADTAAQRAIANDAFTKYQQGLLSYADAQKIATQATQGVQQQIASSQLSDAAKMQEMAKFTPYGVTSGTGTSFVNPQTGQAGFTLSPELQKYQQGLYGQALQAQQGIAATPEAAAQKWYEQQQGLLAPGRAQQDVQNRASQLQRGTLGLGVSSEAAGFGKGGGLFNAQQASVDRARAQADAALAAQATQQGQAQAANQLALAQGLFGAGYQPEQYGMQNLKTGVDIGNIAANQGAQQARLYSGAMAPYYTSLLGAAETGQQAALFTPQATQQGIADQYKRQQDQLAGLLNYQNLNYSPMSTPSPQIPGSAYIGASLGSNLLNTGLNALGKMDWSSLFSPSVPSNWNAANWNVG